MLGVFWEGGEMKPNFVEYYGCPNCYKSFPKKEMKKVLHPHMNVYIYLCKKCARGRSERD